MKSDETKDADKPEGRDAATLLTASATRFTFHHCLFRRRNILLELAPSVIRSSTLGSTHARLLVLASAHPPRRLLLAFCSSSYGDDKSIEDVSSESVNQSIDVANRSMIVLASRDFPMFWY